VTDRPPNPEQQSRPGFDIDSRVTRPARLYNYLVGGDANFGVDRRTAESVAEGMPGGLDTVRTAVKAIGDFLARVVRYLVEEAGARQLLYVGTSVPAEDQIHLIAHRVAPDTRVVYVGNDPVVMALAHTLRQGTAEGATAYVQGTLRAPERIWDQATQTLDPCRPVAILIPSTLCLVPDEAQPHAITRWLLDVAPSGSHLMAAHPIGDMPAAGRRKPSERLNEALSERYTLRTPDEVTRFFDGLDLVDPGLVPIDRWRPAEGTPTGDPYPMLGAVGLKP
jgi:S-adenosyl methyltransferase